jgi:hypothetical protein
LSQSKKSCDPELARIVLRIRGFVHIAKYSTFNLGMSADREVIIIMEFFTRVVADNRGEPKANK